MSKPFVLRAVHGDRRGQYFAGYDPGRMCVKWSDRLDDAQTMGGDDAAGNVMALIDRELVAAIPEVVGTATDDDRMAFARTCALGMFQPPEATMIDLIVKLIRESADEPLNDAASGPQGDGMYMSVWEWVLRCMEAKHLPTVGSA